MLQLFNYCPIPGEYEYHMDDLQDFMQANNLHGLELFVYSKNLQCKSVKPLVKGVHLRYWPYWLDFWQGDFAKLQTAFVGNDTIQEYYWGAENNAQWIEQIKLNISVALDEQPEYLVWHVANSDLQETFTFDFKHTDAQVVQATAELFNAVADCIPPDICVLFENLWWPGLRLTDPQIVADFFAAIKHPNTGIMLDLGHLLSTNPHLKTEEEGYAYAQTIVRNLGANAQKIKGVHLNYSLSGEYVLNLDPKIPENFDVGRIYEHVTNIDRHLPCQHKSLAALIQLINPTYLVHELFYNDLADLQCKLRKQQLALQG